MKDNKKRPFTSARDRRNVSFEELAVRALDQVSARRALFSRLAHSLDHVAIGHGPGERPAGEPVFAPAEERLGGGVPEAHDTVLAQRNDGVGAAVERRHQPVAFL